MTIDQQVTQRAATNRRCSCDHHHSDQIEALSPRGQRAAYRKNHYTEVIKHLNEHTASSFDTHCPIALGTIAQSK